MLMSVFRLLVVNPFDMWSFLLVNLFEKWRFHLASLLSMCGFFWRLDLFRIRRSLLASLLVLIMWRVLLVNIFKAWGSFTFGPLQRWGSFCVGLLGGWLGTLEPILALEILGIQTVVVFGIQALVAFGVAPPLHEQCSSVLPLVWHLRHVSSLAIHLWQWY